MRFRTNIISKWPEVQVSIRITYFLVVTGLPAFAEDDWKAISIGFQVFRVVSRTVRCKLPNVDPNTGVKHKTEPDNTIRSFRCIGNGAGPRACLGMSMVPVNPNCEISAGEKIRVLEVGEHSYIKPTGVRAK